MAILSDKDREILLVSYGRLTKWLFSISIIHFVAFLVFLVFTAIYSSGVMNLKVMGELPMYIQNLSGYAYYATTPISTVQTGVVCMFMFFFSAVGLLYTSSIYSDTLIIKRKQSSEGVDLNKYDVIPTSFYAMSMALAVILMSLAVKQNQIEFLIPAFMSQLLFVASLQNNGKGMVSVSFLASIFIVIFGLFPSFVFINNYGVLVNSDLYAGIIPASYSGFVIGWLVIYYAFALCIFLSNIKGIFYPYIMNIVLSLVSTVFNIYTAVFFFTLANTTNFFKETIPA